ncbi:MAG TPA: glycosyltransferase family 39 protein [Solirubrobacteraceae bacterium]|nr:glycosyltransferase family 39 protein [Solirubrobacteraceae bacterium]
MSAARRVRVSWGGAVLALCAGALALRLWGVEHGLPYSYNADENAHFVPTAIGLFGHGWNPHYFVNPPGYTYLLHAAFALWFGGREAVYHAYATHPSEIFVVARVCSALIGTLAVWLLYLAGARLFDRRTGLLAAAILAVAFLPVFYSHEALNDVPTLAPIALSLWGTAGILRFGRTRDYLVAGLGLGIACAVKYTGGVVIAPLLAAAAIHGGSRRGGGPVPALRGLLLAGALALAGFLALNPYALLDFQAFRDGLRHQTSVADDSFGKLGLTESSGHLYYLWTATWGLGWVPAIAAAGGAVVSLLRDRRIAAVLIPAPVLFIAFMGTQSRYFGRWLLPVFPVLCLLAAYCALWLADRAAGRVPALRPALLALAAVAMCGQGLIYSIHQGLLLSRPDTRNLARAWLVANLPVTAKIVVEPVVPDYWASDIGHPSPLTSNGYRWVKWPTSRTNVGPDGRFAFGGGSIVNIEDYERGLFPGLVAQYRRLGYCWVVSGSTQRGRAEAEPHAVPRAIAYYRELERQSTIAYEASPYRAGARPPRFNFDWSFDFYPLAYSRPGPLMTIYRLRGCTPH